MAYHDYVFLECITLEYSLELAIRTILANCGFHFQHSAVRLMPVREERPEMRTVFPFRFLHVAGFPPPR